MTLPSTTCTDAEAGFATPAAATVSLAIALIASAMMTAGVTALRSARSDYARTTAEYALASAHTQAVADLIQAKPAGRYAWSLSSNGEPVQALAESEVQKLGLADAAELDNIAFVKLGVADPDALRARLASLASSHDLVADDVEAADASAIWRSCARSLISPFGEASTAHAAAAIAPARGPVQWRIGEVWRIRTTLASGWTDDRIVRFTGDVRRPTAVIERRFDRSGQGNPKCDALLASI